MTSPTGILEVDKPSGPTSHDVVDAVRRAAGTRRVGHAGTLDPFASGLLLILLGPATRLAEYFLGMDKEYEATVLLGVETSSHDPEGEIVSESRAWAGLGENDLERALDGLRGRILQTPPALSAKKVKGEAAHRRVRRGEKVELDPVWVEILDLRILQMDLPRVRLALRCSSGTYVRALARDLGRSLGTGGSLTDLRRTRIGSHSVDDAVPLADLSSWSRVAQRIVPPGRALRDLPSFQVDPGEASRVRQGQFLPVSGGDLPERTPVRVMLGDELVAVATREDDTLRPRKVLSHG